MAPSEQKRVGKKVTKDVRNSRNKPIVGETINNNDRKAANELPINYFLGLILPYVTMPSATLRSVDPVTTL